MIAESLYNLTMALPEKELERFYGMLGVVRAKTGKPNRIDYEDVEITERLIKTINKNGTLP